MAWRRRHYPTSTRQQKPSRDFRPIIASPENRTGLSEQFEVQGSKFPDRLNLRTKNATLSWLAEQAHTSSLGRAEVSDEHRNTTGKFAQDPSSLPLRPVPLDRPL